MHQSERPKIMPDLKRAILATIDTLNEDQDQINRACLHARVGAQLCLDAERKHFEHFRQGRDENYNEN